MNFEVSRSGENPKIKRIYQRSGEDDMDAILGNRMDMDFEHWGVAGTLLRCKKPTYDLNGNLLPENEWAGENNSHFDYVEIDNDMHIEKVSCNASSLGEFYGQIQITDIYGNQYGSNIFSIQSSKKSAKIHYLTTRTRNGQFEWKVYQDHAVLLKCHSTNQQLIIPGEVKHIPVTEIYSGAFDNAEAISSVVIPESLVKIHHNAFAGCYNLTEIVLPETIQEIQEGAFSGCYSLTEIQFKKHSGKLAERTERYSIKEHALYDADQTTLIANLSGINKEKIVVSDGTKRIGSYAFSGANIKEIVLPEGLKEIGDLAFDNCLQLSKVSFPDSLESIGHAAFQRSFTDYSEPSAQIQEIYLGSQLSYIGRDAFSGVGCQNFIVSDLNKNFASVEGMLTTKDKDVLLVCPDGREGTIVIPEGITTLSAECITGYTRIKELIFSNSLSYVHQSCTLPFTLEKLFIGKNVTLLPNNNSITRDSLTDITVDFDNKTYCIKNNLLMTLDGKEVIAVLHQGEREHVVIPEGVEKIAKDCFAHGSGIKTISLPASLTDITEINTRYFGRDLEDLKEIIVSDNNQVYSSVNGMLLSADKSKLLYVPAKLYKPVVPKSVKIIGLSALDLNKGCQFEKTESEE